MYLFGKANAFFGIVLIQPYTIYIVYNSNISLQPNKSRILIIFFSLHPTKHLFILLPALFWLIFGINFLQWCRLWTFWCYFGQIALLIKASKKLLICWSIITFLVQVRCRFNAHFSWAHPISIYNTECNKQCYLFLCM